MRLLTALFALVFAAPAFGADAFADLNAYREANRLPKFTRDEGLSKAAEAAVQFRAAHRVRGHMPGTPGDFGFLPRGVRCDAAGCNLGPCLPADGIMACGLRDDHTHAGAAVAVGPDGIYWHVFYRGGSGRELIPAEAARPAAPYSPVADAAADPNKDCNCGPACECPAGACPAACPKPDGPVAAEVVARCRRGEVFVKEVKAGEVPGVPAGVHVWRQVPDGRIRWDRVAGCPDGKCPAPPRVIANPFAVPGCASGRCPGSR